MNSENEVSKCSICEKTEHDADAMISFKMDNNESIFICDECGITIADTLRSQVAKTKKQHGTQITPKQIVEHISQFVIGQDHAKKQLAVAIFNHYKRIKSNSTVKIEKSNILMLGPTGSGKTHMARAIAEFLHVPFAIADATSLTEAGYVGSDVETVLQSLIMNADGNIEAAQQGIIFIDEIDKIASQEIGSSITKDVGGRGVQQSLLKLIEGTISTVPMNGNRKSIKTDNVQIDTTNILFICSGAFVGLITEDEKQKEPIGFTGQKEKVIQNKKITQEDLRKFGMIPEFVGRLPVICQLEPLTKSALKSILVTPKNAIIKQYQELCNIDNISLEFTDEALDIIVDNAMELKTGARSLRSIVENVLQNTMYEYPDQENLDKIVITANTFTTGEPDYVYKESVLKAV